METTMNIKALDNGRIFVVKNGRYFLIEKYTISGTMISNYIIFEDIYNDLEWFLNEENDDKYWYKDFATLYECLYYLEKESE